MTLPSRLSFNGCLVIAVALASFGARSLARADDAMTYRVQIVQPLKIGDRLHMRRSVDETISEVASVRGASQSRQSSETKLTFSGTLEVLAVDKDGSPSRWKVVAEVASVHEPDAKSHQELVKPGTEFTAERKAGKVSVSGRDAEHALPEIAMRLLPLIFETSGPGGDAGLNRILRPAKPAPIGTIWNIDAKEAAAELHTFDPQLKPADVTGSSRLVSLSGDQDKKTLVVEYSLTAKSKNPAGGPHGMTPTGPAVREESGSFTIPADLSIGYFSSKATVRLEGTFKKTDTEKKPVKVRTGPVTSKTVNKPVKVEEDAAIAVISKVSTLLTYERIGGVDKTNSGARVRRPVVVDLWLGFSTSARRQALAAQSSLPEFFVGLKRDLSSSHEITGVERHFARWTGGDTTTPATPSRSPCRSAHLACGTRHMIVDESGISSDEHAGTGGTGSAYLRRQNVAQLTSDLAETPDAITALGARMTAPESYL